jgi:hypothetical protein
MGTTWLSPGSQIIQYMYLLLWFLTVIAGCGMQLCRSLMLLAERITQTPTHSNNTQETAVAN